MSAIGNRDVDREYWLAHCDGFQVLAGKRRIGFVLSLVFWTSWGGFGGATRRDEGSNNTTVVR